MRLWQSALAAERARERKRGGKITCDTVAIRQHQNICHRRKINNFLLLVNVKGVQRSQLALHTRHIAHRPP